MGVGVGVGVGEGVGVETVTPTTAVVPLNPETVRTHEPFATDAIVKLMFGPFPEAGVNEAIGAGVWHPLIVMAPP